MDSLQEHNKMTKKNNTTLRGDKVEVIDTIGEEQQSLDKMIERLEEGRHGHVPDINPEVVVRLFSDNTNNLGLHNDNQTWKLKRL